MIQWTPGVTLEIAEKLIIQQAFRFYRSNKTQTASSIGISIRTLDSKLEKYDADKREEELTHDRLRQEREQFLNRQRGITTNISSPHQGVTAGIHMEPITQPAPQSKVSMPERTEVQEVLPRQASRGHSRKNG